MCQNSDALKALSGLPRWLVIKNLPASVELTDANVIPGSQDPLGKNGNSFSFLPGESHAQEPGRLQS